MPFSSLRGLLTRVVMHVITTGIMLHKIKMNAFVLFRSSLHSFAFWDKRKLTDLVTSASSSCNYRYLTSPEKKRQFKNVKKESRARLMHIQRLECKLSEALERDGVVLGVESSNE